MALDIGSRIGPYDIRSLLGAGGMGEVYEGYDTRLQRPVAIKVLPAATTASAEHRERFAHEARLLAALSHPNVVTIHAIEEIDGHLLLVMELVEGQPLTELIPTGGLSLNALLDIALP